MGKRRLNVRKLDYDQCFALIRFVAGFGFLGFFGWVFGFSLGEMYLEKEFSFDPSNILVVGVLPLILGCALLVHSATKILAFVHSRHSWIILTTLLALSTVVVTTVFGFNNALDRFAEPYDEATKAYVVVAFISFFAICANLAWRLGEITIWHDLIDGNQVAFSGTDDRN